MQAGIYFIAVIAEMHILNWSIGCSGFYYNEWKGVFYPVKLARNKWFEYYCSRFNTLEINSTFYRFPTATSLLRWYNLSPNNFLFAVKVPRLITHYKKLADAESLLVDFYRSIMEGLKEKLGIVLFQLPAIIQYSEDFLKRIMASVSRLCINAFEFRHESWWNENVYRILGENNIVFCSISHPQFPLRVIANASSIYVRMHGVPVLYRSEYSSEALNSLYSDVKNSGCSRAFIYFNNTADTNAIMDVQRLQKLVNSKKN